MVSDPSDCLLKYTEPCKGAPLVRHAADVMTLDLNIHTRPACVLKTHIHKEGLHHATKGFVHHLNMTAIHLDCDQQIPHFFSTTDAIAIDNNHKSSTAYTDASAGSRSLLAHISNLLWRRWRRKAPQSITFPLSRAAEEHVNENLVVDLTDNYWIRISLRFFPHRTCRTFGFLLWVNLK